MLVLGVSGLIIRIKSNSDSPSSDGWVLLIGTVAFVAIAIGGVFEFNHGLALILLFVGFLFYSYVRGSKSNSQQSSDDYGDEVDDLRGVPSRIPVVFLFSGHVVFPHLNAL